MQNNSENTGSGKQRKSIIVNQLHSNDAEAQVEGWDVVNLPQQMRRGSAIPAGVRRAHRKSVTGALGRLIQGDDDDENNWQVLNDDNSGDRDKQLELEIKGLELKAQSHAPDCGYPGEPPHLSRHFAIMLKRHYQIGFLDEDGNQTPFSFFANFGWHDFPFFSYFHSLAKQPEVLSQYGVGISLYFKMLKALICIFLVMNLFTIPAIIMYRNFSVVDHADVAFSSQYEALAVMSYTSIGALGQPIPSCRQVDTNHVVAFSCPGEGVIQSVIAYYGTPLGSCSCPGNQQLDNKGICLGKTSSNGYFDTSSTQHMTCSVDKTGAPLPCFPGTNRFGEPCCSAVLNSANGQADFSNQAIAPNASCNSFTAPIIANALCLNQNSCAFNLSESLDYRFPVSALAYANASIVCKAIDNSTASPTCVTDLLRGGIFDLCPTTASRSMIFEAICVETTRTVSGRAISHETVVQAAVYLNAISMIIFIMGIFWIRMQQKREDLIINANTCRANQYTVCCDSIPSHSDFSELRRAFFNFFETSLNSSAAAGVKQYQVADVNFSTSCYQYLQMAVRRGELAKDIDRDIVRFCYRIYNQEYSGSRVADILLLNRLKEKLYQIALANDACQKLQFTASDSINRAYVTFETEEAYIECMRRFGVNSSDEPEFLGGKPVIVREVPDPSEINWQNVGFPFWSRVLRIIVTTILIAVLLSISYFAIFEANYLASKLNAKSGNNQCGTYDVTLNTDPLFMNSVDSNTITYQKVQWDHDANYYNKSLTYGSNGFISCYCKAINYESGSSAMNNYKFYNAVNGMSETWCKDLTDATRFSSLAGYFVAFVIIVVNVSIRQVLRRLVAFEQWEDTSHEKLSGAFKIFFGEYINTGLLSLLIFGKLNRLGNFGALVSDASYFSLAAFSGKYDDFSVDWYSTVGVDLMFTMWLFPLGSQMKTLIISTLKALRRQWDRRTGALFPLVSKAITHCSLQDDLTHLYEGVELEFEAQCASVAALLFVCMTYSGTMPLMNLIALSSLIVVYVFNKVFLLHVYKTPPAYSKHIPLVMTSLLLAAAFIHCCVAIWQFSDSDFFKPEIAQSSSLSVVNVAGKNSLVLALTHDWNPTISFTSRMSNSNIIILFLILFFLAVYFTKKAFRGFMVDLIGLKRVSTLIGPAWMEFFFPSSIAKIMAPEPLNNPPYFESLTLSTLQHRIALNNTHAEILKRYKSRLTELTTRGGASKIVGKQMVGLESYDINNSSKYAAMLGFQSEYLGILKPSDYLLAKTTAEISRRRSSVTKISNRRSGVVGQMSNIAEIAHEATTQFQRDAHASEVKALLEYCSPTKDASGRWVPRPKNIFSNPQLDLAIYAIHVEESKEPEVVMDF